MTSTVCLVLNVFSTVSYLKVTVHIILLPANVSTGKRAMMALESLT